MRISTSSYDSLLNVLKYRGKNLEILNEIEETLHKLLDLAMLQEYSHIKHPVCAILNLLLFLIN